VKRREGRKKLRRRDQRRYIRRLLVAGRTREVGTLRAFNNHVKHERRLQRVLYQVEGDWVVVLHWARGCFMNRGHKGILRAMLWMLITDAILC
jgi:hypothetical protein